jgi:hypothetical protein
MRIAALRHTEMAVELATFQVAMSSAMELVLGCSPSNIPRMEVIGELVAELQMMEGLQVKLEQPAARIYELLLGPPPDQA